MRDSFAIRPRIWALIELSSNLFWTPLILGEPEHDIRSQYLIRVEFALAFLFEAPEGILMSFLSTIITSGQVFRLSSRTSTE